jgi:hypothetical protein
VQFTADAHAGVADGSISVTFRYWKRPHVKVGGQYNVGPTRIAVDSIELVPFSAVSEADARRAGCTDREALRALIAHAGPVDDDTIVHHIEFHRLSTSGEPASASFASGEPASASFASGEPASADFVRGEPASAATPDAIAGASARLDRLDRASPRGPWTRAVLALIDDQPGTVSTELAALVGRERAAFKQDVRKLKAIGLTDSLEVGYRLTDLGRAVLET